MEVFVRLQNGRPLVAAEVRSALDTSIARFVTDLTATTGSVVAVDEDGTEFGDPEARDARARHAFFRALGAHYPNRRKGHRQVCDQLIQESLRNDAREIEVNVDYHTESLLRMYRLDTLQVKQRKAFSTELEAFRRAFTAKGRLSAALSRPNSVAAWYRVWRALRDKWVLGPAVNFHALSQEFDHERLKKIDPELRAFNAALASSGYTPERNRERARIVFAWLWERTEGLSRKDSRRTFDNDEKYVLWYRAGGQCQWHEPDGSRCPERFASRRMQGGTRTASQGGRTAAARSSRTAACYARSTT